ncbi:hypothetical protein CRI77_21220 [Mycolicibacterium duvalii]|uniref:Uncharacterized protein n=1 Tax=Mycolicibacterium duvalii TaxID=39688 RepID=A0A7I7JXC5_9MYCO|nr:hypothetical protein [Mycolicibacterium duvalii]MCV7370317.1 hypothetical protein [Mycolicibacterium duvalii]PEG37286.1 hypothetical protein CRI77_21220 [Mycolicibacterium duvalii]BBX16505.1 hypothetical protein MDUV_13650 [Mycolicibacterium duvalii]
MASAPGTPSSISNPKATAADFLSPGRDLDDLAAAAQRCRGGQLFEDRRAPDAAREESFASLVADLRFAARLLDG